MRDIVPLGLELSNAFQKLGDGSRDVGKLDDISLRSFGQLTKCSQLVSNSLLRCEAFREMGNETSSHRYVSLLNLKFEHERRDHEYGQITHVFNRFKISATIPYTI